LNGKKGPLKGTVIPKRNLTRDGGMDETWKTLYNTTTMGLSEKIKKGGGLEHVIREKHPAAQTKD